MINGPMINGTMINGPMINGPMINGPMINGPMIHGVEFSRKAASRASHHVMQAIASEGLAHCPYVAARCEIEPATFRTAGTEHHPSTNHAYAQVYSPRGIAKLSPFYFYRKIFQSQHL